MVVAQGAQISDADRSRQFGVATAPAFRRSNSYAVENGAGSENRLSTFQVILATLLS
jgi:hypothetical protein